MVVDGEFVVYLDIFEELDDTLEGILRNFMNEPMAMLIKELQGVHSRDE